MSALNTAIVALCIGLLQPTCSRAAENEKSGIETTTAQAIRSLMEREGIPGVAVGIVCNGQSYIFNFGIASRATGKPITDRTLFEGWLRQQDIHRHAVFLRANLRTVVAGRSCKQISPGSARQSF